MAITVKIKETGETRSLQAFNAEGQDISTYYFKEANGLFRDGTITTDPTDPINLMYLRDADYWAEEAKIGEMMDRIYQDLYKVHSSSEIDSKIHPDTVYEYAREAVRNGQDPHDTADTIMEAYF
jgi:hypothetical protein